MILEVDAVEFANFLDACANAAMDDPGYLSGQLTAMERALRRHVAPADSVERYHHAELFIGTLTEAVRAGMKDRPDPLGRHLATAHGDEYRCERCGLVASSPTAMAGVCPAAPPRDD